MLIVNGTVVPLDGASDVMSSGAVCIRQGRIHDLGAQADLLARYPEEERLDARGMLVMPGFVSAHTRLARSWTRGRALNAEGAAQFWQRLDRALDHDTIRYGALLGCIEAIRSGTTTLFDRHSSPSVVSYSLDDLAEAVSQSGLRACLSYAVSDRLGSGVARDAVEENVRYAGRVRGDGHLSAALGLESCTMATDETIAAIVGSAAVAGRPLHVGLAGDALEARRWAGTHSGLVLGEWLRRRGVLGRRTLAVGCTHILPDDVAVLAQSGVWAVHDPRSAIFRGGHPDPLDALLDAGAGICLGSGELGISAPAEMRALGLRPGTRHPERLVRAVLQGNATIASRWVAEGLGRLAVGAPADVILLESSGATPITAESLPWHLIHAADGACVDTTIVGGRVLMRHRALLTLDAERISARARELAPALWARLP
jgi:cytosine/adenosine deaminase-related metal-dependent hydrolase